MAPDAGHLDGVGPARAPRGRPRGARGAGSGRSEFSDALSRERSSVRGRAAAEVGRVSRAVESQEGLRATGVRLLRRYSPLERDAALYEVRTERGAYRVVAGRDGSLTVFKA